jgi:hypothetical protein
MVKEKNERNRLLKVLAAVCGTISTNAAERRNNAMVDVIIPTWAEVNFWVVVAIASAVIMACLWVKGKIEDNRPIKRVTDWEE